MSVRRTVPLLIVALLGLFAASLALAGCGGSQVTLSYTYKPGDTWVQEVSTTVQGTMEGLQATTPAESSQSNKARVTSKVESVSANGVATISVTTETIEASQNGQAQDLSNETPKTVTVTVDKTGKVLSTKGAEDAAAGGLMQSGSFLNPGDLGSQLRGVVFPADGTAKVGEEWTSTSTIPLPGLDQSLSVNTTSKLVSVTPENGTQVAVIEYTTKVPMDLNLDLGPLLSAMLGSQGADTSGGSLVFKITTSGSVTFSGKAKVDLKTGQTLQSDANGSIDETLEVTDAPESMVPKDQWGPFHSLATLTMQVITAQ
jgi:hypothetical protein